MELIKPKKDFKIPCKQCMNCGAYAHNARKKCVECGAEFYMVKKVNK